MLFEMSRWARAGNTVIGLQLGYYSPTEKLIDYSDKLRQIRGFLPKEYRLSITGLADWSYAKDPKALINVAGQVDELAFQLYQGENYVARVDNYISGLKRLDHHYKIGSIKK